MLIDNKTNTKQPLTLWELFQKNITKGRFDAVSGFFSVSMLAEFYDKFPHIDNIRLIFERLTEKDKTAEARINLFAETPTIEGTLGLSQKAQKAVRFLESANLFIKTYRDKFCHAKTYIYEDAKDNNSFFAIGSSNFTHAGLTDVNSGNIELNFAKTGEDADFEQIKQWFNNIWAETFDTITVNEQEIAYKEYIIQLIKKLYKEYTPEQLYFKILYELFYEEIKEETSESNQQKLLHLKESIVWNNLYEFQKRGVLSLIRMLQRYNGAILGLGQDVGSSCSDEIF